MLDTIEVMKPANPGIVSKREQVSKVLLGIMPGLVSNNGPCALTGHHDEILAEGERFAALETDNQHLVVLRRLPPWKPRSKPESWWGEETTNESGAVNTLQTVADRMHNVSIELGLEDHPGRYMSLLSFAWSGARNFNNKKLLEEFVLADRLLPFGVKNDLSGDIDELVQTTSLLSTLRGEGSAPVVPIWRGGDNAQDPHTWEQAFRKLHDATGGLFIVDAAHGGEMAHHPGNTFEKSQEGQIACLDHIIELALKGVSACGVMIETSDVESPVDPVIPVNTAMEKNRQLHKAMFN